LDILPSHGKLGTSLHTADLFFDLADHRFL
jgi:hypothetical protein